jgi:hypothetical protein
MKITTFVLMAAVAMSPSVASAQDRGSENRAAVRRMFPIVSIFDKKKTVAAERNAVDPQQAESAADALPAPAGDAAAVVHSLATAPGDTRDVAGIRVGMTPAQAMKAAAAAGYSRTESKMQEGWGYYVRQEEQNRSLPKLFPAAAAQVQGSETYQGSGSQKLVVDYTSTPRGAYVYSVRYSVNMSETPWETMKERTRAKYGRENYATASQLVFCSRGETKCNAFGLYVLTTVDLDFMPGSSWLTLSQGSRYRNAYQAAINAEVDRLHPKNDRPAF